MQNVAHHYHATAAASIDGCMEVNSDDLPEIITAAPAEFGGPGAQWSPEHLLVSGAANCFILGLSAVARFWCKKHRPVV